MKQDLKNKGVSDVNEYLDILAEYKDTTIGKWIEVQNFSQRSILRGEYVKTVEYLDDNDALTYDKPSDISEGVDEKISELGYDKVGFIYCSDSHELFREVNQRTIEDSIRNESLKKVSELYYKKDGEDIEESEDLLTDEHVVLSTILSIVMIVRHLLSYQGVDVSSLEDYKNIRIYFCKKF